MNRKTSKSSMASALRQQAARATRVRACYRDMDRLIRSSVPAMRDPAMPPRQRDRFWRRYRRRRMALWARLIGDQWEDEFTTIFEILRFQLRWLRKTFLRNRRHVGYRRECARMACIETLLDRVIDEEWHDQKFYRPVEADLEKRHGRHRFVFERAPANVHPRRGSTLRFKLGKSYEEDVPGASLRLSRASERAERERQRDIEKLFRLLAERIQWWWN